MPPLNLGDAERQRLLDVGRAMGDATRLDVLLLIAGQDEPICACDIVGRFDVSQPTISHHLSALRDAGLVRASRRGVWAYYEVDPAAMQVLSAFGMAVDDRLMVLAS